MNWQKTKSDSWQGRDDKSEGTEARRLFKEINILDSYDNFNNITADTNILLGFSCDEGVKRNQGRVGAAKAPLAIRNSMGSLAIHENTKWLDAGDVVCNSSNLEHAQNSLANLVKNFQKLGAKTLVLGGGHETAFAHGLGIYQAHNDKKVGIINFDAHLDMRSADIASSGTPFLQLANYCQENNKDFNYLCIGASKAANTTALINNAKNHNTKIIWDNQCFDTQKVLSQIDKFINKVDIVYLTVDLDVLHSSHMFAVSAPAAFGIPLFEVMQWLNHIRSNKKFIAGDVVEYNPDLDHDNLCAKIAARIIWQMG